MSPGGLQLDHPVLAQRFVAVDPLISAKRGQTSKVEDHKNDKEDDVDH